MKETKDLDTKSDYSVQEVNIVFRHLLIEKISEGRDNLYGLRTLCFDVIMLTSCSYPGWSAHPWHFAFTSSRSRSGGVHDCRYEKY